MAGPPRCGKSSGRRRVRSTQYRVLSTERAEHRPPWPTCRPPHSVLSTAYSTPLPRNPPRQPAAFLPFLLAPAPRRAVSSAAPLSRRVRGHIGAALLTLVGGCIMYRIAGIALLLLP